MTYLFMWSLLFYDYHVNEFAKDSLSTCQVGEKTHKIEGTLYFKIKPSILGCSHSFIFL